MGGDLLILKEFLGKFKTNFWCNNLMDKCHLVCYPSSGTCSLRGCVSCILLSFFPFNYPQIPSVSVLLCNFWVMNCKFS